MKLKTQTINDTKNSEYAEMEQLQAQKSTESLKSTISSSIKLTYKQNYHRQI